MLSHGGVATKNSSEKSKKIADYVGDGVGDQEEIYKAIHALPEVGGTVTLTAASG